MIFACLFIMMAGSITSCGGDDEAVDAQFERNDDWTVPPNLNNFQSHFFVKRNITSPFYNLPLTEQSEIGVTFCELWITGFQGDLSVLREITLWIVNPENSLDRIECAYVDYIKDEFTDRIRLSPSLSNMYELAKLEKYDLELELEFRTFSTTGFDLQLNTTFFVRY